MPAKGQVAICQLEGCGKTVPREHVRRGGRYCTIKHRHKASRLRVKAKNNEKQDALALTLGVKESSTERTGEVYEQLMEQPDLVEMLIRAE